MHALQARAFARALLVCILERARALALALRRPCAAWLVAGGLGASVGPARSPEAASAQHGRL